MWTGLLASFLLSSCVLQGDPVASATRGITGKVRIESDASVIRGRPDLDRNSPLLVRLARVEPMSDGGIACELEFIGVNVGVFDLREVLVFEDGSSIDALDPIPIEIVSNLERDAPTDLALAAPPATTLGGGYTATLVAIGIAWVLVPVIVLLRRLLKHEPPVEPAPRGPTLAEKLAPLVESAANRDLSIAEQGRLELLLYAHWQDRLGLVRDRPGAVEYLRNHEVAGRLLRSVERWLHEPRAHPPSRSEINALLEPYRHVHAGGVE